MTEFVGGKIKVRCVDCTRLVGTECGSKRSKVSIRKRRSCGSYNFKGEFENREPADAVYVPYVDPKTRRMIKKLMKLGVMPNNMKGPIPPPPPPSEIDEIYAENPSAFKSTATAQIPVVGPSESVGEMVSGDVSDADSGEETVIWSPEDE